MLHVVTMAYIEPELEALRIMVQKLAVILSEAG